VSSKDLAENLAPGTVIAGRYRVERQLGQGGMGHVFLVQHVHTDERLALKLLRSTVVLDQTMLDRFRREARTPARIDSDHVVRVTDADVAAELGNVPFLVMEYLRGEDLQHVAERRVVLPASEVVVFLAQAARALDKAHGLGIVHRDLKPENLFLTQRDDGTPCIKILDFGIAKMTGGDVKEAGRLTATGQIFGTPLYMSPEQALAESSKVCPQTDVWALGLIAHRLLHGKEFWTAETLTHLIAQIAYEPIPAPSARGSTLGPAYDEWFARCCARKIEDRFRSAGEAVSALAAALRVTDTPSALARVPVPAPVPVSVRVPAAPISVGSVSESDMLAETSAADAITSPSGTRPAALGRTQFGAETQGRGRVSRAVGYGVGAFVVCLVGAAAAWKVTAVPEPSGPGSGGSIAPISTGDVKPAVAKTAEPTGTIAPIVTPSPEVSGSGSTGAAQSPSGKPSAGSQPTGSKPGSSAPSSKPSSAPTIAPVASVAVTATPIATAAVTVDPLKTRR
jgi:serine/threonine-protein kinase